MIELLETEIEIKKDEIVPQQEIFLFNINTEIDNKGNMNGYLTINQNADIYYKKITFINNKYVFKTKINMPADKLYIIGDTDFIGYNIISTMSHIINKTQPFIEKLSLEAKIKLELMELKNNKIHRVHIKRYGQTKVYIENEKTHDPIYEENEITMPEMNQIMETKKLKQNVYNVIKVIKVFGNSENELSENITKIVLGLYTNSILEIIEKMIENVIARNWKVLK